MKLSLISTAITSTLISNAIALPVNDVTLPEDGKANSSIFLDGDVAPYYVWSSRSRYERYSGNNDEEYPSDEGMQHLANKPHIGHGYYSAEEIQEFCSQYANAYGILSYSSMGKVLRRLP